MIHLFHGDNTDFSRREMLLIREKFKDQEIIIFDGKNASLTDLKQATESSSLFGTKRLVIIENLFTKKLVKKNSESESYKKFIRNISLDFEIIFWEEKELAKTHIGLFPKNTDIALFQLDRLIFKFLESIKPNVTGELIDKFNHCLLKDSPEMIFSMLIRQFRYLIMVKDIGKNVTELSPWQLGKFMSQANYFTLKDLIGFYKKLLEIDVRIKTSNTAFDLADEIRLFLLNI